MLRFFFCPFSHILIGFPSSILHLRFFYTSSYSSNVYSSFFQGITNIVLYSLHLAASAGLFFHYKHPIFIATYCILSHNGIHGFPFLSVWFVLNCEHSGQIGLLKLSEQVLLLFLSCFPGVPCRPEGLPIPVYLTLFTPCLLLGSYCPFVVIESRFEFMASSIEPADRFNAEAQIYVKMHVKSLQ